MIELRLVGIGAGNPQHLTLEAIRALNGADVILIPHKGEEKSDLADLRRAICAEVVTNPVTRIVAFDLPLRDAARPDYLAGVEDWHDAVVAAWQQALADNLGTSGIAALMVWGDPSLYDSTLRIAARLGSTVTVRVFPGITALSALAAAHAIPLNDLGAPFLVTTGRQLRENGWPPGVDTIAVMLDSGGAFTTIDPEGLQIWWGAYLGMPNEVLVNGKLSEVGQTILDTRRLARARHGWIMDIYLLRRSGG